MIIIYRKQILAIINLNQFNKINNYNNNKNKIKKLFLLLPIQLKKIN